MRLGGRVGVATGDEGSYEPIQFSVGDRVRIKLSPECQCWRVRLLRGQRFDGMTGMVIRTDYPAVEWLRHRYSVMPDYPWDDQTFDRGTAIFAAAELEPLGRVEATWG